MTKEYVFHVTPLANIDSILANGLNPHSYFGTEEICEYYGETINDDGDEFVLIKIPLDYITQFSLAPDQNGIDEPITTVVGMSESDIHEAWSNSEKTAMACFDIIGSFKCLDNININHPEIALQYPDSEM